MKTRNYYLLGAFGLLVIMMYLFTSQNRVIDVERHLKVAEKYEQDVSNNPDIAKIENDKLSVLVEISTGDIVEARLKEYLVENTDGSLGVRVFGSDVSSGFEYYLKTGFLTSEEFSDFSVLSQYDEGLVLSNAEGYKKYISFVNDGYEIEITDVKPGASSSEAFASLYRTAGKSLDLKTDWLSGGMMNNASFEGVGFSNEIESYEAKRLSRLRENSISYDGQVGGWVGFIQKYFLASLIGSDDGVYNYFADRTSSGLYAMGYTTSSGSRTEQLLISEYTHRVFVGPKIRKDLMVRAKNLELSIDMGWFWFLAQPMIAAIDFINNIVGNWGFSILIFTVLLKLVLFPITGKGFKSMAQMRKAMPELKEIQDRYKNDRQKLGAETLKVYRKHGANPLGGCLPLLAQFPFFIALFFGLREMVELRYSPFVFWVQDLSAPDPLFVLPALFGLIMVLTQKLNPQPPNMDPIQQNVMKVMPVMFSIFFVIFPSALALYSVANGAFSLFQQRLLYKRLGAE